MEAPWELVSSAPSDRIKFHKFLQPSEKLDKSTFSDWFRLTHRFRRNPGGPLGVSANPRPNDRNNLLQFFRPSEKLDNSTFSDWLGPLGVSANPRPSDWLSFYLRFFRPSEKLDNATFSDWLGPLGVSANPRPSDWLSLYIDPPVQEEPWRPSGSGIIYSQ